MRTEVRDIEADLCWLMQHNEGLTHEEVMRDMGPLIEERRQAFLQDWRAPSVVDVMGDDILWLYRSGELVAASCGGAL